MKYILFAFVSLLTFANCTEKNRTFSASEIAVLPKPNSLNLKEGSFGLKERQIIFADLDEQQNAVKDLQRFISEKSSFQTNVGQSTNASISFYEEASLDPEAYELNVSVNKIKILRVTKLAIFMQCKL